MFLYLFSFFWIVIQVQAQFNNPPGVPIWCGKAYEPQNASFNPGGWLDSPAISSEPLLDLRMYTRMSLYMPDDTTGSVVVDALLSNINGQSFNQTKGYNSSSPSTGDGQLLSLVVSANGSTVANGTIAFNTSSNILNFPLSSFPPSLTPYELSLEATLSPYNETFTANSTLYRLPARTTPGSVVRLDHLYKGLSALSNDSSSGNATWTPIFPYSFYVDWWSFSNNTNNVTKYKDDGFNMIHMEPGQTDNSAPWGSWEVFDEFLDLLEAQGTWLMYDMRYSYRNTSAVQYQVERLQNRTNLLLWYTGDEPDGNSDPTNATSITYQQIKSMDPYHPISLALNCYNFYYEEYASGADIIMEDVYPIAVNTSFSTVRDTVCNSTYGCCGCDDCHGSFTDISDRLDRFHLYDEWINLQTPRANWGVPQAFGAAEYWSRYPTADEEVVMTLLRLNHDAKGIVMWTLPTTNELENVTSALAKVLTGPTISQFVLGADTQPLYAGGSPLVDASGWQVGNQMLVSIVNMDYSSSSGEVVVALPEAATSVSSTVWEGSGWSVQNGTLVSNGLNSLQVDVVVVDLGQASNGSYTGR